MKIQRPDIPVVLMKLQILHQTPTVPPMAAPSTAKPPQDVPVLQPEPRKIYPKWGQAPIPDIVDLLGMLTILSHDFIYLCKSHVIIRMTMNK